MKSQVKSVARAHEGVDPFVLVKDDLRGVEALLKAQVTSEVGLILEVGRYLLDSGGKRFRPAIHLLSSRLLDFTGDSRLWMAAAIECVHTATLLHDDVVDGASIRRGIPSANAKWGDHTAVLVGDFLFALSVQWVLNTKHPDMPARFASVCTGMAEGEAYQLMIAKERRLKEDDYLHVVSLKTAGLISLACSSAAMLAGADKGVEEALGKFGYAVGMAFQIVDDALDYCSAEDELGKAIGKDLEEGKITLPMLHALEKADKKDRKILEDILDSHDFSSKDLATAQALIHRYKGIDYARERAGRMIDEAKSGLTGFGQGPELSALFEIADFTLSRTK